MAVVWRHPLLSGVTGGGETIPRPSILGGVRGLPPGLPLLGPGKVFDGERRPHDGASLDLGAVPSRSTNKSYEGFTLQIHEAIEDLITFAQDNTTRYGMGFEQVDKQVGMVGRGELALMWARSGSGKSTWVMNVVRNTPWVPTAVISMEMSPRRQAAWLTAMTSDLDIPARYLEEVVGAGPDDARYYPVMKALEETSQSYPNLHLVWMAQPTVDELAMQIDLLEDKTGVRPERVFVDHLGLMKGVNSYESYTETSELLHSWCIAESLALFVLQQTGRSGNGGDEKNNGHIPVTLNSGLYGGEAAADYIFGMYRPDRDPKYYADYVSDELQRKYEACRGMVRLQVIKNRTFGEVNERGFPLRYDPRNMRLTESY